MAETAVYSEPDAKLGASAPGTTNMSTNKRKRSSLDHDDSNTRHGTAPGDSSFNSSHEIDQESIGHSDFSALVQHNNGDQNLQPNGGGSSGSAGDTAAAALSHYTMTVPQATEISFQAQNPSDDIGRSFSMSEQGTGLPGFSSDEQQHAGTSRSPSSAVKPQVGTDEWHKVRRDNHKEVERRRRETINEGINELAKIVPGCEKNKGSILQRAVQFITQLKENENSNIEKWTLEKLVTEQALTELSEAVDRHRANEEKAWKKVEQYKKKLEENGISVEDEEGETGGDR